MLLKHVADDLTKGVIVLEGTDLGHPPEPVKGLIIQLIDLVEVRICHDAVRQCLHIADAMGESGAKGRGPWSAQPNSLDLSGHAVTAA